LRFLLSTFFILSQGFSPSNLRTGQITVFSSLKIQFSEEDDDDEEFMQLPYPAYYS
jgi:hypothetical protein